eukprot:gene6230-7436_t
MLRSISIAIRPRKLFDALPCRNVPHGVFTSPSFRPASIQTTPMIPTTSNSSFLYVDKRDHLEEMVDGFQGADLIGMDTEFSSFPAYSYNLQLIQLASDKFSACIDCQAISSSEIAPALRKILDPAVVIAHSCTIDLMLLRTIFADEKWLPYSMVDTQLASNLLRVGNNIGLAPMLQHILGIKLDKSQSLSDWRLRPLRPRQLQYAMNDVHHLIPAWHFLSEQLEELDRMSWLQEDMLRITTHPPEIPRENLWLSLRRLQQFRDSPCARSVLREVVAWREEDAIRRGLHPQAVMGDDAVISIAKGESDALSDLKSLQGMKWNVLQYSIESLQAAIRRGLECSNPPDLPPQYLLSIQEEDKIAQQMALATAYLHEIARLHRVSFGALLPWEERDIIGPWLIGVEIPDGAISLTKGWRLQLCGMELMKVRQGEKTLSVSIF